MINGFSGYFYLRIQRPFKQHCSNLVTVFKTHYYILNKMIIDIILIFFAITGIWLGYAKGLARTLLTVVTYLMALVLTLIFSPWLAEFLSNTFPMGKLFALIFGTIAVFILLSYLLYYLTKKLDHRFKTRSRTTPGKISGGIVMLLFSIILYGLLLGAVNQFKPIKEETKETSISYPLLQSIPAHAVTFVETFKPIFRNYWEMMQETVQQSKSKE